MNIFENWKFDCVPQNDGNDNRQLPKVSVVFIAVSTLAFTFTFRSEDESKNALSTIEKARGKNNITTLLKNLHVLIC